MEISKKAVFLDLDETILDRTESLKDFALWQAQGMLRNSVSDPNKFCDRFIELDSIGSVWKDKVYAQLSREFHITDWSVKELLQSYELCLSGFTKPKHGVAEAIKQIHSKEIPLGLLSNGKSPFQERCFNSLGLSHMFSSIIVSEAVGYRKPDVEIFRIACKSLNVSPDEAVFIGDNPVSDIEGARKVGMYTIYVPGYYGQTYENADAVCNHFSHLFKLIENAI